MHIICILNILILLALNHYFVLFPHVDLRSELIL